MHRFIGEGITFYTDQVYNCDQDMINIYSVSNSHWDNFLVCAPKRHTEKILESKRKIKSREFSVKWAYVPFGCTHIFFHFYLAPISSFSYPKTHALVRLVSDDTQSLNWSTMKFFYPFILKILVEFSIEISAVSPIFFSLVKIGIKSQLSM